MYVVWHVSGGLREAAGVRHASGCGVLASVSLSCVQQGVPSQLQWHLPPPTSHLAHELCRPAGLSPCMEKKAAQDSRAPPHQVVVYCCLELGGDGLGLGLDCDGLRVCVGVGVDHR